MIPAGFADVRRGGRSAATFALPPKARKLSALRAIVSEIPVRPKRKAAVPVGDTGALRLPDR